METGLDDGRDGARDKDRGTNQVKNVSGGGMILTA